MSLARSTLGFSAMTLVSRVLGFVRDVVLARAFGAGPMMDAFIVAFKIPNFLRRLFAEGSFSLAFVPVLNEYRERGDAAALKSLIDATAGSLMAVLLLVTGLGMLAAPWVVALFAPGFVGQPEQQALASDMLRITFPYLLLVALTALAAGVLNTLGRFALPALTPALLNVAMIAGALLFAAYFEPPIKVLAWAVLIAGALQLLALLPSLARHGVLPRPWPNFKHPGVRRILTLMGPTLFGSSVAQINLLIDTLIASLLLAGSISWLYYADRLMEFPLGLFGVALSTVIMPTLSRLHARDDQLSFKATLDWALLAAMVVGVPAAVGLASLAPAVVIGLFQYGQFGVTDAAMTARALAVYCLGLPAFMLIKILSPGFFSRQDVKTPVKIAVVALVVNMALNVVLVVAFVAWLAGGDFSAGLLPTLAAYPGAHVALALASSLTAWLNAGLLWWKLAEVGLAPRLPVRQGIRVMLAALFMAVSVWLVVPASDVLLAASVWQRLGHLFTAIALGLVVYAAVLALLGLRPADLARPQAVSVPHK